MNSNLRFPTLILALLVCGTNLGRAQQATDDAAAPGATLHLGARRATVLRLDSLPYVESDYTRRFRFDSHENPKLGR